MKGLYPRLAMTGIRKNKKLYLPYLLTCIGMVTMFYIIVFLKYSEVLSAMPGKSTLRMVLGFGSVVIAVFAFIFLFYTNSFLTRRRKREFGLYNILGMSKVNIGRILIWESVIIALIAICAGLGLGIALSKLAELFMVKLLNGSVTYTMSVSVYGILITIAVFGVIFFLLLLSMLWQLRKNTAIALLRSEHNGEKPPKANLFWGLIGLILLAGAYWLAVSIKEPIQAMFMFLIAVLMVILATYLIFISGSVLFCRMLQKNKHYYYKSNHFVSVSGLVYRMKRNGAGLASICIIITMVLVMISSTTCLYFGNEDALDAEYPRQITTRFTLYDQSDMDKDFQNTVNQILRNSAVEQDLNILNSLEYSNAKTEGTIQNSKIQTDNDLIRDFNANNYTDIWEISVFSLAEYNRLCGTSETLDKDEILIYTEKKTYDSNILQVESHIWQVKKKLDSFFETAKDATSVLPILYVVAPDMNEFVYPLTCLSDHYNDVRFNTYHFFDTDGDEHKQIDLRNLISERFRDLSLEIGGSYGYYIGSRAEDRADFLSLYGSLFFLGILLSIVFLFAAVLIIYYKQISEGYEDASRFAIMKKLGMSDRDIRKSINSQLLTVFFMPLLFAGLHLAFAFPILSRILTIFALKNIEFLILTTVISFAVIALFYILIYKITTGAYYAIVNNAKSTRE